ncbi:hypothetical protein MMC17_008261 [Xylographa soralifera]|nr:hypothetical protein [Xylographa soralifera]
MFMLFSNQKFLSGDGLCKSFDEAGDGHSRGDGVAAIILKRVKDAGRNGDLIRAIVRGTGVDQDGLIEGITLPSAEVQASLISSTYISAGLDGKDMNFFEAHKYQAVKAVYSDNDFADAAAKWTDAIVHLSGFVLNGNYAKPDEIAYIATGLESLRIIGQLPEDRNYTCYTSILPSNVEGVSLGNVYLFDGSELVALCTDSIFKE